MIFKNNRNNHFFLFYVRTRLPSPTRGYARYCYCCRSESTLHTQKNKQTTEHGTRQHSTAGRKHRTHTQHTGRERDTVLYCSDGVNARWVFSSLLRHDIGARISWVQVECTLLQHYRTPTSTNKMRVIISYRTRNSSCFLQVPVGCMYICQMSLVLIGVQIMSRSTTPLLHMMRWRTISVHTFRQIYDTLYPNLCHHTYCYGDPPLSTQLPTHNTVLTANHCRHVSVLMF